MKRITNHRKEVKPAELRDRGLRILARIIAKIYLRAIQAEREEKSESSANTIVAPTREEGGTVESQGESTH